MKTNMRCRFCRAEMGLGQQFRYLVEVQTADDPVMMAAIRRLPQAHGRPLRCCEACQTEIERRRRADRASAVTVRLVGHRGGPALLLAVLAVGMGLLTARAVS